MKVSIIIPVYNVEKYIERCLLSVFQQTYYNLELIVVNDCTPDKSMSIVENLVNKLESKFKLKIINHAENKGLATARNTGFENSGGDYIMHIDSDDYIDNDYVERMVSRMNKDNSDMVLSNIVFEYTKGDIHYNFPFYSNGKELFRSMLQRKNFGGVVGILISRDTLINNNIKSIPGINYGEDIAITPRIAYYSKRVSCIDKSFYHYDCSNVSSYTRQFNTRYITELYNAIHLYKDFIRQNNENEELYNIAYTKCVIALLQVTKREQYKDIRNVFAAKITYSFTYRFDHNILLLLYSLKVDRLLYSLIGLILRLRRK